MRTAILRCHICQSNKAQSVSQVKQAYKHQSYNHHYTKQDVMPHHAHHSHKQQQSSGALPAIFGGQYASAYDGSDLFINGPSINTDEVLLMIDQKNQRANSLVLSGAFEALATHDFLPDTKSSADIAAIEVQSYGTLDHIFHAFVDTVVDPKTLNGSFPRAFITIGDLNRSPFYATAGKFYVPFGSYSGSVLNTLPDISEELGGIKANAVTLGMNEVKYHLNTRVFAYRPNVRAPKDHDLNGGVDVEMTQHFTKSHASEGISVVSNIADSDGLHKVFGATPIKHRVGGLDIRGKLGLQHGINFVGEYTTAMKHFALSDMQVNGKAVRPSVLHLEANKGFQLYAKPAFAALGMNQSYQAAAVGIPQTRIYGVVSVAPVRRTQIALELNDDIAYKNKHIPNADGKSHLSLYLQAGLFF
jgi:hypothetical protein